MASFDANRPWKLINRKSGAALSASGTAIGSAVWLWKFVNGGGQVWFIVDTGDGFVRIENRHSGRILAAPSGGLGNGTKLHVWDDLATLHEQHWRIDDGPAGFVHLRNRASGRIASCSGGGTTNGTEVLLWDALDSVPDQDWALLPAPAFDPAAAYRIVNKKSNKVLCVVDGGMANGSPINLFPYIDFEDQRCTSSISAMAITSSSTTTATAFCPPSKASRITARGCISGTTLPPLPTSTG
jgi:hypothetical protein